MSDWLSSALELLSLSNHRIVWNLFLAFIPLVCSWFLFRSSVNPSIIWWTFFLFFLAFLPNAPYILTDTIHLLEYINQGYPPSLIIFVLIPQYTLFILAGFGAYAIALGRLNHYLIAREKARYTTLVNLLLHALCAVGIYLGRFERFNSWDLLTQPEIIITNIGKHLLNKWDLLGILSTFLVLFLLDWLLEPLKKQIIAKSTADILKV